MKLTPKQMQEYKDKGMLFIPDYFPDTQINKLHDEILQLPKNLPGKVMEKDNKTVRALHGVHAYSKVFKNLIQHPFLLQVAQQILGDLVYLYQFKINMKASFTGDIWPWHQDFIYWQEEDGMPEPKIVNVNIFLDEVNQFNGPLYLIPYSHQKGVIRPETNSYFVTNKNQNWKENVNADLKYCLNHTTINKLVEKGGIVSPIGSAGSILFFHSNIAHASLPNISPYPRRQLIITYNSIKNVPSYYNQSRPEFLVSRDSTPLHSV